MVNFNSFRSEITKIQKEKKSYDVFVKQTLLGFLKDACVFLRNGIDSISHPDGYFQIERSTMEYAHTFNIIYHYNEVGHNYPRKIKVISISYYPGGDVSVEVSLWNTNGYEGSLGMEMREKLLMLLMENNMLGEIVKKLNHIIPMVKDLQTKQKQSENSMWKNYRNKTEELFTMVKNNLLNGESVTLTQPYDFNFGKNVFFGDVVTFVKIEGKRNGILTLQNTITQTQTTWEKLPLNSLARIARDIVYHEKNLGE